MRVADFSSIPWDTGAVGTCGQIQPCNDIRLMDVPDMNVGHSFQGLTRPVCFFSHALAGRADVQYTSKDSPNPRGE
jgi:long-chain acyl-CoA synthetase